MKTRLCELAEKWHTDKVASIYHDYTPFYSQLLEGRNIRRVLEIGIGTPVTMMWPGYIAGASLKMWEEYFPEAEIFGLDIDPESLIDEGRIKSFLCDQGSLESLKGMAEQLGGVFDLIIDDGSHQPEHQLLSTLVLTGLLAKGGVYVIEDVSRPDLIWTPLVCSFPIGFDFEQVEFEPELLSKDNRLIVIRRAA